MPSRFEVNVRRGAAGRALSPPPAARTASATTASTATATSARPNRDAGFARIPLPMKRFALITVVLLAGCGSGSGYGGGGNSGPSQPTTRGESVAAKKTDLGSVLVDG